MLMITGLDSLTSIHWLDDDTWCVFLSIVRLFHFSFIYMLSNHNSSFLKVLYIVKKRLFNNTEKPQQADEPV